MKKESKPMDKFLQCFFINFIIGLFITSICILFANSAEVNNESIFIVGVFMSAVWGMLSVMRKESEIELEMENDALNQIELIELNALGYKTFRTECGATGYVSNDHLLFAYPGDSGSALCYLHECNDADHCIINSKRIRMHEYVYGWDEADKTLGLNRFDRKEEDV